MRSEQSELGNKIRYMPLGNGISTRCRVQIDYFRPYKRKRRAESDGLRGKLGKLARFVKPFDVRQHTHS